MEKYGISKTYPRIILITPNKKPIIFEVFYTVNIQQFEHEYV